MTAPFVNRCAENSHRSPTACAANHLFSGRERPIRKLDALQDSSMRNTECFYLKTLWVYTIGTPRVIFHPAERVGAWLRNVCPESPISLNPSCVRVDYGRRFITPMKS